LFFVVVVLFLMIRKEKKINSSALQEAKGEQMCIAMGDPLPAHRERKERRDGGREGGRKEGILVCARLIMSFYLQKANKLFKIFISIQGFPKIVL
jgi:hypothetical protein